MLDIFGPAEPFMYPDQIFLYTQRMALPYSLNISRVKIFAGKPDFLQKIFRGKFFAAQEI